MALGDTEANLLGDPILREPLKDLLRRETKNLLKKYVSTFRTTPKALAARCVSQGKKLDDCLPVLEIGTSKLHLAASNRAQCALYPHPVIANKSESEF